MIFFYFDCFFIFRFRFSVFGENVVILVITFVF
jgi:hypothetical protein